MIAERAKTHAEDLDKQARAKPGDDKLKKAAIKAKVRMLERAEDHAAAEDHIKSLKLSDEDLSMLSTHQVRKACRGHLGNNAQAVLGRHPRDKWKRGSPAPSPRPVVSAAHSAQPGDE
jgi:hypothetical protein